MPEIQRVYLDACALLRLFDDWSQPRLRDEADAVEKFFIRVSKDETVWVTSEVLEAEILNNPHRDRRHEAMELLALSSERLILSNRSIERAAALESLGYGSFDALHLACAEQARVDSLLTTDDRFIRRVKRSVGNSAIQVENPLDWTRRLRS
jgi:predicted nucleic acid-binding protein